MIKILFLALGLGCSVTTFAADPSFKHVVVVVFENANYQDAVSQPFFAQVAKQGSLFTQFIAEAHPSQANYIAMIGGDTLGVLGDNSVNLNAQHLGNLLEKRGLDWKAYAEDLPSACFLGASNGKYARKHVPFYSFTNVQNNPAECAKVVNANLFQKDWDSDSLPAVSFYIPNLDHDGHDTGAAFASNWFATAFGSDLANSKKLKDTLFVVTFDESKSFLGPNLIYTAFIGANVMPGTVVSTMTTHYSVLKMIETGFGLGNLGKKDASALPITGIWQAQAGQ